MPLVGTTTSLTPTNNSDANFRAWGSAIAAKLLAAGLVQTADTGQINWTTVTAPIAADTAAGYEIWRFNDTLQATAPVFIKVEYGSGLVSANNPGLWFTFGGGSNGSGTLTGNLSTRLRIYVTASTNAGSCYWCGDNNRFVAALFTSGTGYTNATHMMFSFERTVNSSGAVTADGVLILLKAGLTTGAVIQQLSWSAAVGELSSVETNLGTLMPQDGTGTTGADVALYPVFHHRGLFLNPGKNLLCYFHGAITPDIPFSFTIYGASIQYMPVGTNVAGTSAGSVSWTSICSRLTGTSSQPSYMVRYDA